MEKTGHAISMNLHVIGRSFANAQDDCVSDQGLRIAILFYFYLGSGRIESRPGGRATIDMTELS